MSLNIFSYMEISFSCQFPDVWLSHIFLIDCFPCFFLSLIGEDSLKLMTIIKNFKVNGSLSSEKAF